MNQCADSRKTNLAPIGMEPLKDGNGWLLSHTGDNAGLSGTVGSFCLNRPSNECDLARQVGRSRMDERGAPAKDTERSARVCALRPLRPVHPEFVQGGRLCTRAPLGGSACAGRRAKHFAAIRRELRPVAEHAGRDAIDVRNFR